MIDNITPLAAVTAFSAARQAGDIGTALEYYAADPALISPAGDELRGRAAARAALEQFAALRGDFVVAARAVIECGDVALHHARWTIVARDGRAFSGESSDVLHRDGDGRWLLVIDNPYGGALLR